MPPWRHTLPYFAPLLLTLLYGTGVEAATLITKPPVSVNASLGSLAIFTCEAVVGVGRAVVWDVTVADPSTFDINLDGNMYMVTMEAIEENDCAEVICRVISTSSLMLLNESKPAVLKVQGLLDPPSNLTVTNMDTEIITLAWNEPFTLNLTNRHPDISHYTVYIHNGTDFWSENVTQPQYNFTGMPGEDGALNPCSTYSFSVSAWNVVGEGNRSSSVEGYFITDPPAVQEVTMQEFYFSQGTTPRVAVSLRLEDGNFSSCPGSQPDAISALVNCGFGRPCRQRFEYNSLYSSTANLTVTSTHNCIIPLNTFCEIGFSMVNGATSELPKPNTTVPLLHISTHDIQEVDMMPSNNSVTVVCHFARGSQARGCLVYLTSRDQQYTYTCSLRVDRKQQQSYSSVTIEGVPPDVSVDTFNLSVFDIEKDNIVARSPAHQHSTVITLPRFQSGMSDLQCTSTEVGYENGNGSEKDNGGVLIGSVLGVVLLVLVAVMTAIIISTAICIIRKRKSKRKRSRVSVPGLQPTENKSYEMVATYNLQQQVRVSDMKPCPAYVQCTPRR